ncbi:hypothetical protein Tco_0612555 [Tanacetum coccineum]
MDNVHSKMILRYRLDILGCLHDVNIDRDGIGRGCVSSFTLEMQMDNYIDENCGLVAETFDWDEEEVFDDEEETRVQVLMALADDELSVGKNHARNE